MIDVTNQQGSCKADEKDDDVSHYAKLAQSYDYHFKMPPNGENFDTQPKRKRNQCLVERCVKKPFFNYKGEAERNFCEGHKLEGMVIPLDNHCELSDHENSSFLEEHGAQNSSTSSKEFAGKAQNSGDG
mmetsp:Transcript_36410/g.45902  ORF Transcript_36410/g.45902 Transcript_36410/m.45902 type:complete len:129 (-) Transcript_36410:291-677(-)